VLVDTGFGTPDIERPEHLGAPFRALTRPQLRREETALEQIRKLGFHADDVRDIVVTHLDLDHAGGLRDFPKATVHVLDTELEAATNPKGPKERARYPKAQRDGVTFQTHKAEGEDWFGFQAVQNIPGLPEDILMVPLIGHTRGHTGIAVRGDDGWLLHAGDAYFDRREMDLKRPRCKPGLRYYQVQMEVDRRQRLANQRRLRELVRRHGGEVRVICAHDPVLFEEWAQRSPEEPVAAVPSGAATL